MDVYETEQQQVEAIKRWWKENGRSVIAGLVLGIGGMLAWRSWSGYAEAQATQASTQYQQVLGAVGSDDKSQARAIGEQLIKEYPKSPYSTLSALILARLAADEKDYELAQRHLRWVLDHGSDKTPETVVRIRLARVLLEQGEAGEALGVLEGQDPGTYANLYYETKGDILLSQGDKDAARGAYRRALAAAAQGSTGNRAVVQMKLDNLGDAGAPKASAGAPS